MCYSPCHILLGLLCVRWSSFSSCRPPLTPFCISSDQLEQQYIVLFHQWWRFFLMIFKKPFDLTCHPRLLGKLQMSSLTDVLSAQHLMQNNKVSVCFSRSHDWTIPIWCFKTVLKLGYCTLKPSWNSCICVWVGCMPKQSNDRWLDWPR